MSSAELAAIRRLIASFRAEVKRIDSIERKYALAPFTIPSLTAVMFCDKLEALLSASSWQTVQPQLTHYPDGYHYDPNPKPFPERKR